MEFGPLLKHLRSRKGIGIKSLAPDLGVSYSYISKLESGSSGPSEEFIARVSEYFHYDNDELLLAAGKIPADVLEILRSHPQDAVTYLKERFGTAVDHGA